MGELVNLAAYQRVCRERDAALAEAASLKQALIDLKAMEEAMKLNLTPTEARIFAVLRRHGVVSTEVIMGLVYDDRPEGPPDYNSLAVFICKMRKKLRFRGFCIENYHGHGYRLVAAEGGEA